MIVKKYSINKLEDLITFVKDQTHESPGKPMTRGVARSYQVMLENIRDEWKRQRDANKARKQRNRKLSGLPRRSPPQ
jgi:hypothetical protein